MLKDFCDTATGFVQFPPSCKMWLQPGLVLDHNLVVRKAGKKGKKGKGKGKGLGKAGKGKSKGVGCTNRRKGTSKGKRNEEVGRISAQNVV